MRTTRTYTTIDWIDSGYAENKEVLNDIKAKWKEKNPKAKVKRVRTNTKGLLMYVVELEITKTVIVDET